MPKSQITKDDWERANSCKIPSLAWVSLDAALRPIEAENARTSWVDLSNGVLRIPRRVSAKNTENWIVSLQDQSVDVLERWLAQRKTRRSTRERMHCG